ncbi:unnamed protein product [Vitrella brassicaformis CCMP3155]|uniref:F-box domain-containing protein n=1 Tax=Vitrella brassicaformis (strain CCMP3155) TaxID=1169540 RepID=A0A0G4GYP0_VITBC|nr:unnamed protein product [Vitrella brassicaformis CCMP3155]|eukprot:CEM36152.1 unnamed protein product [Vitrella brassicaformis CCMP3155]
MANSSKKQRRSEEAALVSHSGGDDSSITQPDERHAQSLQSLHLLPDDVRRTVLSELLGTQCIIGTLSLVRKAFHTIATDPQMHRTIYLRNTYRNSRRHKPIPVTDRQTAAWSPRLTRTKRIVMMCPVEGGLVRLIEATRKTLTFLKVDDREWSEPVVHQSSVELEFPVLAQVAVAGHWVQVAEMRMWRLSSLESLCVSSSYSCCHPWHHFSRALHTLELDHADGLHWGSGMPAGVDLSSLKRLTVTDMGPWDAQRLSECGLKLDAFDMTSDMFVNSAASIKAINAFRIRCLAAGAEEVWRYEILYFNFSALFHMTDADLLECAQTIQKFASMATSASLPVAFSNAHNFSPQLYSVVSKLNFPRVSSLSIYREVRHNLFPVPAAFLSRIGHMFPHVTEADLFSFDGEGLASQGLASLAEGHVQSVLEQLGNLTVVRCGVDIEEGVGEWSLWVDEAGEEEADKPFHERMSRATHSVEVCACDDEEGMEWSNESVVRMHMHAIAILPCLHSIVLEVDLCPQSCCEYGRQEDSQLDYSQFLSVLEQAQLGGGRFHALLRAAGFDLVELTPLAHLCCVEVRRIGFVGDPMQRKITDYFSAVQ